MEIFSDWRFAAFCGAILLAIGEARYQIRSISANLSPKIMRENAADQATMIAEIKSILEDVQDLKKSSARFSEKYDQGTARIWDQLEALSTNTKERLAKIEGKMG